MVPAISPRVCAFDRSPFLPYLVLLADAAACHVLLDTHALPGSERAASGATALSDLAVTPPSSLRAIGSPAHARALLDAEVGADGDDVNDFFLHHPAVQHAIATSGVTAAGFLPLLSLPSAPSGASPTSAQITAACWSSSRPAVICIGRASGLLEVWDILERASAPFLTHSASVAPIVSLAYQRRVPMTQAQQEPTRMGVGVTPSSRHTRDMLAAGDSTGALRTISVPRSLRAPVPHERSRLLYFLTRERQQRFYAAERLAIRSGGLLPPDPLASHHKAAVDAAPLENGFDVTL
jgi:hypothetical protein